MENEKLVDDLTPKQVAMALRVSESSIKRWCDRGVIHTHKTHGGHRRISIDALMTFLESTNRQILDSDAIGITKPQSAAPDNTLSTFAAGPVQSSPEMDDAMRASFETAMVRGDESECRKLLIQWYSAHQSFASVADDLVAPTFRKVGELWNCGDVEIFQERRGCQICSRLIHEFRRLISDPVSHAPTAIGGSASGDHYSLPGQIAEVVLREAGWRAVNLGCNLPFSTLTAAVKKEKPRMVFLSVSHVEDWPSFVAEYQEFAKGLSKEVNLVIGGRALTDQTRPQLSYTAHCDKMQNLATLARAIRGQPFHTRAPEI